MKKVTLTILFSAVLLGAMCQENKVKFGIKAGGILAKQKFSSSGYNATSPSLTSFSVGVFAELPRFSENKLSIQPNVLFTVKGTGKSTGSSSLTLDESSISYVEIPINFLYHASDKVAVGIGPYFGYALSGKVGTKAYTFDSNDNLKRSDFGYNLMAQVTIANGFGVSANYSSSLSSIVKVSGASSLNKVIGVSLFKYF